MLWIAKAKFIDEVVEDARIKKLKADQIEKGQIAEDTRAEGKCVAQELLQKGANNPNPTRNDNSEPPEVQK